MSIAQILSPDSSGQEMKSKVQTKQSIKRRDPRQARALRTRELIFETALQILEDEGPDRLSTNRIAERSGFGVGTIYQYFENKQQIMSALRAEELRRSLEHIRAALETELPDASPEQRVSTRVRAVVRILLQAFGGRHGARRRLMEQALQAQCLEAMRAPVTEITRLLGSHSMAAGSRVRLSSTAAFVLAHAISGPIRAAIATNPALLQRPEFEQALVRLAVGYLDASRPEDAATDAPQTVASQGPTIGIRRRSSH